MRHQIPSCEGNLIKNKNPASNGQFIKYRCDSCEDVEVTLTGNLHLQIITYANEIDELLANRGYEKILLYLDDLELNDNVRVNFKDRLYKVGTIVKKSNSN